MNEPTPVPPPSTHPFNPPLHMVKNLGKPSYRVLTTSPDGLGPLARKTLEDLRQFLMEHTDHRPSQEMWLALADLADTLEKMADGRCEAQFYLSSLDPGVGKTQTISRFVRVLMASTEDRHRHVGAIICVSRLSEIWSLVSDMDLDEDEYSVLSSDRELNQLGCGLPQQGRVLFTTQQMVESRCKDTASFVGAEEFLYQGRPRAVRIWDESILPGQTITINRDDLAFLFRPLRGVYPALTATIENLFSDLKDVQDGRSFTMPDFAEDHGVDVNEVLRVLDGTSTGVQAGTASALWFLSGKVVAVRTEGFKGNTVIDYKETLPHDLAPVVVLDASGRVRATYREWEDRRGGLVRLRTAEKAYDNLTIHCWRTAGSKSAFRRQGMDLVEGIVAAINSKPHEQWLVVHHKATRDYDVEATVRDLVNADVDKGKIHFLPWGQHHATNEFSHVRNVILAGTLFYRTSQYEALGRLSGAMRAEDGVYGKDARKRLELGEHAHLVLQALCRGAVRVCRGGRCAPCDAYIIAHASSGIEQALPSIFPGCSVVPWQPVRQVLMGKLKDALEHIEGQFTVHGDDHFVPFAEVKTAIGVKDASNFRKNIRQHPDFQAALAERMIFEDGQGKRAAGFRKRTAAYYGFTA